MAQTRPPINPFVRSGNGLAFEVNYSRRFLGYRGLCHLGGSAVFNLDEDLQSDGDIVPTD